MDSGDVDREWNYHGQTAREALTLPEALMSRLAILALLVCAPTGFAAEPATLSAALDRLEPAFS